MDLELRKLPEGVIIKLSQFLDSQDAWKPFMALIPQDTNNIDSNPKYKVDHIQQIEIAGNQQRRSCSKILLEEWSTSGKIRPTIKTLLQVLEKAELFRAVKYVREDYLKEEPVPVPVDAVVFVEPSLDGLGLLTMTYDQVSHITNNFDETPLKKYIKPDGTIDYIGHKLGSGAFGSVYFAIINNKKVAIKFLNNEKVDIVKQFENEIKTLSKVHHENLLPLLGYSNDNSHFCLIYEYMEGGSLLERLAIKPKSTCSDITDDNINALVNIPQPLDWKVRVDIAVGSCRGIQYLHQQTIIHRDIKTANILLDDNLTPKIGDFGLVKELSGSANTSLLATTIFGTSAYMPPEAFNGNISVLLDVFSFGVVLLELLTGLVPYDETREEGTDLATYVEDVCEDSIRCLLDENAGAWREEVADCMWQLSKECLEKKKDRLYIGAVLEKLEYIQSLC